jgi:hypothetical protein
MNNFFYITFLLSLFSCSQRDSKPGKLDSDDFDNKSKRIEALEYEIKSFSEIIDTEFELFNANGFNGQRMTIPGASSWDYRFVIRIDPSDISKWTEGFVGTEIHTEDLEWLEEIVKNRKENWIRKSKPEYFKRAEENVVMVVFRDEGIIFKRLITM